MSVVSTVGTSRPNVSDGIRRVIWRDDQLQLAFDAEAALEIARTQTPKQLREALDTSRTRTDQELRKVDGTQLFQLAYDLHLQGAAEPGSGRYTRAQSLSYAGRILEFCNRVGHQLDTHGHTPNELFDDALADASPDGRRRWLRREPTRAVLIGHLAARSLRLAGDTAAARKLVAKPEGYFFATGVERMRARYEHELCVGLIHDGQAGQVRHALSESEDFWQQGRAVRFTDRHRYRYAVAIADWEVGRLDEAERELYRSLTELDQGATDAIDDWPELCRLSLTLTLAELHLERATTRSAGRSADRSMSVDRLTEAQDLTQRLRARWRVIIRSRSPLSSVIQRIWGDMARVAAGLGGETAHQLGAQIALAAKQSGFAHLMRAERSLLIEDGHEGAETSDLSLSAKVVGIIDQISQREAHRIDQPLSAGVSTQADVVEDLKHARSELLKAMTPVLADFILPRPVDLPQICEHLGDRVGLDFVALRDTLSEPPDRPRWYRTLFTPGGGVEFDPMLPGAAFDTFFRDADHWMTRPAEHSAVWDGLGADLLPDALRQRLSQADPDRPIRLVVCGHEQLSNLPWAALRVGDARLVEQAIITQALDLTGLTREPVAEIIGPALVRLVPEPIATPQKTFPVLDIAAECAAWGLRPPGARPATSMHAVRQIGEDPIKLTQDLASALSAGHDYRFLHVAAHGTGDGLDQRVYLPGRLSAGAALGLPWPSAVLLVCCRLGRVNNVPDAEPFGFVICLLSANARAVVAGVDEIDDAGAGAIASRMVQQAREGPVPIDEALRRAQLDSLSRHRPLNEWALLATYVC